MAAGERGDKKAQLRIGGEVKAIKNIGTRFPKHVEAIWKNTLQSKVQMAL